MSPAALSSLGHPGSMVGGGMSASSAAAMLAAATLSPNPMASLLAAAAAAHSNQGTSLPNSVLPGTPSSLASTPSIKVEPGNNRDSLEHKGEHCCVVLTN